MAINVITGQPRNGKSQRAVALMMDVFIKANDKLEEQGLSRRPIYTDIDGINAPDTPTKLPDCIIEFEREKIWFGEHDDPDIPEGYWCPPYGSIFFFDECHKLEWVKDSTGSISKNPTTITLNEHGHAGHDIYLMTQFPNYIHTHIRGLVQEHWHCKRIVGLRQAWVYKWDEFILNPRAKMNIDNVYEKERFKFKPKYENAYKSASAHAPIKFKFPKVMLWVIVPLCIIIPLFIWKFSNSMFAEKAGLKEKAAQAEKEKAEKDKQLQQANNQTTQQGREIDELRAELKELKAKYLPAHINTLAQFEEVRPAMVIEHNGACQSFNRYGEPLNLPDSLCMQMNAYPVLIPRSRTVQNLSTADYNQSQYQQNQNQNQLPNQQPTNQQPTNIQYFDHSKDFKTS